LEIGDWRFQSPISGRSSLNKEGIVQSLLANRRRRAVAGVNDHVVGQREQLVADAGDQRIEVAAGEIRPADTPLKQHIATEDGSFTKVRSSVFEIEHDVAGRVTRREARLEAQRADFKYLSVVEGEVGVGCGSDREVEGARAAVRAEQRQIERVQRKGSLRRIDDVGHRADVIEVSVRQEDEANSGVERFDSGENCRRAPAGVDHSSPARVFANDDVAVGLNRPHYQCFYKHVR